MGKPYAKELEKLSEVYEWATKTPIDQLSEFVKKSAKLPLYVIGSGGSFSATTLTSLMHQHAGTISRCLTPFEFLEFDNVDNNCSILIITAGGNNKDILSSFDKAVNLKPKFLGILCASTNNKLTRKASKAQIFTHAVKLPTGKDGFLATNSLLATAVWLMRAYMDNFSFEGRLPNSLSSLSYGGMSEKEFEEKIVNQLQTLKGRETIVILYDNWGKMAAVDAESKLVEAGLVNVQLADYRNFAHGRHNWLDKNKQKTGLIAIVTPKCAKLARKTIELIPKYIPTVELSSNFDGPVASLDLLIKILYVVKFFGKIRGIDPGKPRVAMFGRKIYHLSIPKNVSEFSNREQNVLQRKFPNSLPEKNSVKITLLKEFVKNLENAKFGGVVFDYDGTLCDPENRFKQPSKQIGIHLTKLLQNDIIVGIATGRGKSVRKELQKIIPKKYWQQLLIGYYNGADLGYLNDDSKPNNKVPADSNLKSFFETITKSNILPQDCKIEERPLQVSIQTPHITAEDMIAKINTLKLENNSIRIVESSHSIDFLAEGVSKLNLFNEIKNHMNLNNFEILCIGDKGKWPGNDFELLKTNYSLSVDETSEDPYSCWNMLSTNAKGEKAVLEYLNDIEIHDDHFMLNLGMKK